MPPEYPCEDRGLAISKLREDQAVTTVEMRAMRDSNAVEHKAIMDALASVQSDLRGVRRILIGENGDNGLSSRVRRLEDTSEVTKLDRTSNKTLWGVVIASGLALFGTMAQALAEVLKGP